MPYPVRHATRCDTLLRVEQRPFGNSGFSVSVLGFGAGHIGGHERSDHDAGHLLNSVLDLGVTLLDTARGYGLSEERIGRHLSHRRDEFVLSTKGGYGVDGVADWTPEVVTQGIENALRRMNTDRIDIFHLHSCPLETLRRDDLLGALEAARAKGLIRVAAYSGENDALEWAVNSGRFGGVQTSVNLFDQRNQNTVLPAAQESGVGVIAKRPIGNAAWTHDTRPVGQYAETYWHRLKTMNLEPQNRDGTPGDWLETALRFSAHAPGVSSIIVGTGNLTHLRRNAELLARGPLPEGEIQRWREAFAAHDHGWEGQV
jgi:aryl-alcohol dehydrogenase-like predicted oxidoreductase